MPCTVVPLFSVEIAPETEAERLRRDLADYRAFLLGTCLQECLDEHDSDPELWSDRYEQIRTHASLLGHILDGCYPRSSSELSDAS